MTSTDHYVEAERLLEHAASMLNTDVHPQDRAELVARQAVIVAMASAHAALADAAMAGLSAHLDTAGTQAWRRVAAGQLARGRWVVPGLVPRRRPAARGTALDDAMPRPASLRLPSRITGAWHPRHVVDTVLS
jgi:hypothetical protein